MCLTLLGTSCNVISGDQYARKLGLHCYMTGSYTNTSFINILTHNHKSYSSCIVDFFGGNDCLIICLGRQRLSMNSDGQCS